jgi:2-polyprenyl-6-methoxyphenol hydroxylase-like FAD-dependent oxidoreductase
LLTDPQEVLMSEVWSYRHAVVIGASIGGLCTARALSDVVERVTLVDRDELPATPVPRRGVPQGRHLHLLLARGLDVLEELFPGLSDELVAAGALAIDLQSDFRWHLEGHLLRPEPSGLIGLAASRPLLECAIRSRVEALRGVTITDSCEVTGLTTSPDRLHVTGVRTRNRAGGTAEPTIDADLVVDASGRGSRSPAWLNELWCSGVPEERPGIQVTFVSRIYRREHHYLDGFVGGSFSPYPSRHLGGIAMAQEGDRFIVTLAIRGEEKPPTSTAAMADYADGFSQDIAEVIRTGEPLSATAVMRFPGSIRRRFEKLNWFPDRYLVIADALCSFSPRYAQGMTVAALQALMLSRLIREGNQELHLRFFPAAAVLLDTPWDLMLAGPSGEDERTDEVQAMDQYLERYRAAAAKDALLATELIRVINMLDEPSRLIAPDLAERVDWVDHDVSYPR